MTKLLSGALAVLLVAASPAAPTNAVRHSFTLPHVLRYTTGEEITGLNPHLDIAASVTYMSSLTMAWLIKTGLHGELVPELATAVPTMQNGGVSKDGLSITYHLRKDAKWSDGIPFTSEDIAFTIETILNPATNEVSRDGWSLIKTLDVIDKYTVRLRLKEKYAPFVVTFFSSAGANPCVLPKHLLSRLPNINTADYNALPVGIGPFKYASWKRGDAVVMVPNPLYFRGQPKLQRIIFKIVPDRNTALTQMQTHEVDMWLSMSPAYFTRAQTIKDVAISRQPSVTFDHLDFNVSHPALADRRVRQALRLGVDRAEIRAKIRHGLGTLSDNVFGPIHPAYHPIPLTPFDLGAATRLLNSAGWKPGPDGIRAKNGIRLSFAFVSSTGAPDADQQIEMIRANWQKLGVELNVRRFQSSVIFAEPAGVLYAGNWDIMYLAWSLDYFGDLTGLYSCNDIPPKGQNVTRWCDKRAEDAMAAFRLEYDPAKRNPYDYIVTDEIDREVPIIVMDIRDNLVAYNSDLKNFKPNPINPFDNMMKVDI